MSILTEHLTLTVPITKNAYQLADQFKREQQEPDKAQQVYLNTLAVSAVDYYLQCIEVQTNLAASYSWNPAVRSLLDIADLLVTDWGRLECRPILPGESLCQVPPEDLEDRVGYVVVEINQETNRAKLLGFAPTALGGVLEINQLASLEQLINQLPEAEVVESEVVNLRDWWQESFAAGWQGVQELVAPQRRLAFRKTEVKQQERAKLIDLGLELAGNAVVLIITVWEIDEKAASIRAQVYPTGDALTLPPNLKLSVLAETGEVFKEVTARSDDEFIQYQFEAQRGDDFGIQLALGEVSCREKFRV
ncbi:MAG: DUF1822 family protein [Symploca sp. SIO1A3]|nr:DUF1822 family protein [Symploca sp. SIO1A3]